jgi:hypothetical protein
LMLLFFSLSLALRSSLRVMEVDRARLNIVFWLVGRLKLNSILLVLRSARHVWVWWVGKRLDLNLWTNCLVIFLKHSACIYSTLLKVFLGHFQPFLFYHIQYF